jgi:SecD/SecF fusion protein
MQAKGLIRFFTIAFILVCIYQLSFTWVASNEEGKAVEYGEQISKDFTQNAADIYEPGSPDYVKYLDSVTTHYKGKYLDSIQGEVVMDLMIQQYTYRKVKAKQINLGLDLQGGMSVVLQISLKDLVKRMANNSENPTFLKALDLADEKQESSQADYVTLFYEAWQEIDATAKLAPIFATQENKETIKFQSSDQDVLNVIRTEANEAIKRTHKILTIRIDQFGVAQTNVTLQELSGRIIVELPGVDNPERVRRILQATAKLEFWETWFNNDVYPYLEQANTFLAGVAAATDTGDADEATAGEEADGNEGSGLKVAEGIDPVTDTVTIDGEEETEIATLESAESDSDTTGLVKLGDATGTGEGDDEDTTYAGFRKKNPLLGLIQSQQYEDANRQQRLQFFVQIADTAKFNEYMAMERIQGMMPPDLKVYWGYKALSDAEINVEIFFIKTVGLDTEAPLTGDVITDARVDFDAQTGGSAQVTMRMNSEGTTDWRRLTNKNVGRRVAIVLDNKVYSAPTVTEEISGGVSSITGQFDVEEARDLANILKAGKLPAPAKIVEEEIVGATLGAESVHAGIVSLIAGLILVLLFMIFYYNAAGIVANVSLLTNLFFIMGVLASFGATLTLPGMAGIVLTIGMAVDANVLIFERIREELRKGSGARLAIIDGYKHSYSSIIDANLTTLLTAFILSSFGMGPIKGFATVLIIGIFSSLFTAILLSRLIIDWRIGKEKTVTFGNALTKNAFSNLSINFIGKRKMAYIVSGLIVAAGIFSFTSNGFELGVDFEGGRSYTVRFTEPANTDEIRSSLEDAFGAAPVVKTFGGETQVKITTNYLINEKGVSADSAVESKLFQGLQPIIGADVDYETFVKDYRQKSQKVEPTISDDIQNSAYWATIFSLIVIFIYILVRFRKWQYGLGAVIALFHNVIIVLTVFSVFPGILPFSLEIDQAFIAAILTVIGYSINDTVVVFDRIREYLNIHRTKDMETAINLAINSTLSRTLITSFTTLIVVMILFIFGGEVIRGFSFAIMLGILIGTYSSIFIATPIVVDLAKKKQVKKA